jgi:uncharacterized protein (DUF2141 family)
MIRKSIFVILLLTFLVVPSHSAQHSITLYINVSGATPSKGHIILSLFSSADNYLKIPILSKTKSVNSEGMADFELGDLIPGIYALNAIYDEDSNGELNTIDGRPWYVKHSIEDGKQVKIAVIDPDFLSRQ